MAETLFTICNAAVLPGWLLLIVAPRWKWTAVLVTAVLLPFILGLTYLVLMATNISVLFDSGGSMQLTDVMRLFQNPYFALAGWVHYLAFDLFVGSWQVRDASRVGLSHFLVIPCLVLTFLLGPIGLVCYFLLRWTLKGRLIVAE